MRNDNYAGTPLVWTSPAINRVANRLSKRITSKRYTAQPETDGTGTGILDNRSISSRSPQPALKKPVCSTSDDIEEESEDMEENVVKQLYVVGYSESHRITSDTDKDADSSTTSTAVPPIEEVKR